MGEGGVYTTCSFLRFARIAATFASCFSRTRFLAASFLAVSADIDSSYSACTFSFALPWCAAASASAMTRAFSCALASASIASAALAVVEVAGVEDVEVLLELRDHDREQVSRAVALEVGPQLLLSLLLVPTLDDRALVHPDPDRDARALAGVDDRSTTR